MPRLVLLLVLVGLAVPLAARAGEETPSHETVLRHLSAPTFAVRRDAVWAARDRPHPAYLERLLVMARKDAHPNIRAWALEALARYEDERVVPTLEAALADDPNPFPQDVALESLGRLHAPDAYETLVAHLAPRSRGSAVLRGLAALGDPRAFDVVLAFWGAHPDDPYVAPAAPDVLVALDVERGTRACLERFAKARAAQRALEETLGERGGEVVREAMVTHLEAAEPVVRHGAARVLARAGDARTDRVLLERFRDAAEDRAVLARALAARGVRDAVPVLAGALIAKDTQAQTRAAIAGALGGLGDARGVDALVEALSDEADPLAAVQMAVALGRIGDARAKGTLRERFDDERVSSQPRTISSVWTFPWNCRVGDGALWAWASIEDGQAPFPYASLSGWPAPPAPEVREAMEALRRRAP